MQKKKVLLIINPCAGKNSSRVGAFDIMSKLSSGNFDFEVKTTRCQGDATKIARENGKKFDLVICCGGDGTLNETINGLLRLKKRVPVGYIPSGSTNDLATTLGIPTGVGKAAEMILSGKMNSYDVGSFNGKYFNYVASFGAGVDISYRTPQFLKNMFGHTAYLINGFGIRLIPMLMSVKSVYMKIEYDGGVLEDKFFFGAISNSTSVAGLFNYDGQGVKLNDGYFELLLVRGLKKNTDAFKILNQVIHHEYDGEKIMLVKTRKVKITCDKSIPWTLDGEFGGMHKNVKIDVLHNAFDICSDNEELFLPKETDDKD